ncbi:MAG: hypothetical protein LBC67_02040 [Spirochaetales bacterium]|jgi:hypothetical protein|nr:hypothetical protein [Spirochaetales bacterium]
MKIFGFCVCFFCAALFSCGSQPSASESEVPVVVESVQTDPHLVIVSEEEYKHDLEDVNRTILELNKTIASGNYRRWKEYLTQEFVDKELSAKKLQEINSMPLLVRNNIRLRDANDYFTYVVVPSRASVRLDDMVHVDVGRVEVFMVDDTSRTLVYQLEKVEDKWKISTW